MRFTGRSVVVRAVSPGRGYQSLSHESCRGFCLHTHQQEFCLSPFPESFVHIKSSFSCTFVSSPYCSLPSLGCLLCNRLQGETSKGTYFTCPWFEFSRHRTLLIHPFFFPLFFSLDFLFKVEDKLHQGQFISFIYCTVACMLGGVLPLTKLVVFNDSPHVGNGSTGREYQLPKKAKSVATLHPLSHRRC